MSEVKPETLLLYQQVRGLSGAVGTAGTAAPTTPLVIGGSDGTNTRTLKVNSDGELVVNLEAADIQIGAVEIKNADTDDRVNVADANTARTTGTHVLAVQHVDAAGGVMAAADLQAVKTTTGAVADAAVTAGATGTVSAKLRAISRDIGALLSSGITITAMDLAGIAEGTVPTIGDDGVSSKLWVNLFGQLPIAGYDLSANGTRVFQDSAPLRRSSDVYTLLDAVSSTQTSFAVDLTGYNSALIWIESAESDGGVNATLQVNRAVEVGDTGAPFGTALTLNAVGQRSTDLTGIMLGLVSVTLTRTTGTFTVKMKAQA